LFEKLAALGCHNCGRGYQDVGGVAVRRADEGVPVVPLIDPDDSDDDAAVGDTAIDLGLGPILRISFGRNLQNKRKKESTVNFKIRRILLLCTIKSFKNSEIVK
jgi:hypothetical protein